MAISFRFIIICDKIFVVMFMSKEFNECILCPRRCMVNRNKGELGFCKSGNKIKIAKAYLHMWEEPPITGKKGSGTIFFSGCNLRCIFCQNYYISEMNNGIEISIDRFSQVCLDLQGRGATNINLVTPTHYVPLIIEGIKLARASGLCIPIVYNSSGYEAVETIKSLDGVVDVYLPDFKYYCDEFANIYSRCKDYFKYASLAIDEMVRQKDKCVFDEDGNIISGVIVRHLIIPSKIGDSKKILKYLFDKYGNKIYLSIMNQYTPVKKFKSEELNRTVSNYEYDEVIDYAWSIGIRQAFVQDGMAQSESFIPKWDFK